MMEDARIHRLSTLLTSTLPFFLSFRPMPSFHL